MGKFVVMYSGTLGMKHNPDVLYDSALSLKEYDDIHFVIISEGQGIDYLKSKSTLDNITLLPFQPFEQLPDVLGSSDCLITLLEPDAGIFSVPSKVWSAYCAGRPSILYLPKENLAAKITESIKAGIVVPYNEGNNISPEILKLKDNKAIKHEMGKRARKFAEENFRVEDIAKKFIQILEKI